MVQDHQDYFLPGNAGVMHLFPWLLSLRMADRFKELCNELEFETASKMEILLRWLQDFYGETVSM